MVSILQYLQSWKQLVGDVDGGVQGVVRAPLLSQGHAQVLHLVTESQMNASDEAFQMKTRG